MADRCRCRHPHQPESFLRLVTHTIWNGVILQQYVQSESLRANKQVWGGCALSTDENDVAILKPALS
eukprot:4311503-Pleurochrysis_carterae.AAC.1